MLKIRKLLTIFCCKVMREAYVPDWPNLDRYKKANGRLMKSKESKNSVVLMGDSITEHWSELSPDFFEGKSFINRGISGQTSPQMLLRFRQDVILLEPSVVVVLAGINDIAGNTGPTSVATILNNIFSMTELAQANDITVVLCSVLPANRFDWNPQIKPAETVIELNRQLKQYASTNNIHFINYYPHMVDVNNGLKAEFGEDGVHPNKFGYKEMEPLLEKVIQFVLANQS